MRVSAIQVRALIEAAAVRGVSSQLFCQRAGLDASRLSNPSGWFSADEFDALLLLALELTGDEALGLHWGENALMIQYDVLPPLVSQARSLKGAIEAILRFQAILADRPEVEFTDRGDKGTFHLRSIAVSPLARRLREEMTAVGLLRLLRTLGSAAGSQVVRVGFTHSCPPYQQEYQRIFGGIVHFDQPACTLRFHHTGLDSSGALYNEELHQTLEAQAERLLQRASGERTYAERLRWLVKRKLPEVLQISEAAHSLGMSERSLRRRLSEESISYLDLVKQSQVELACSMLTNPSKSLKEVAYESGFADATAFHRAFKRLTGTTPLGYRARAVKACSTGPETAGRPGPGSPPSEA